MIANIWATLLTQEGADGVCAYLLSNGYTVRALGSTGRTTVEGRAVALLAIQVTTAKEDITATKLTTDIADYLSGSPHIWMSVVTQVMGGSTAWHAPGKIAWPSSYDQPSAPTKPKASEPTPPAAPKVPAYSVYEGEL